MTIVWDGTADRIGGKYLAVDYRPGQLAEPFVRLPTMRPRVLEVLSEQPMTVKQLALTLGAEAKYVTKVIFKMKQLGQVIVVGRQKVYPTKYGRISDAIYAVAR